MYEIKNRQMLAAQANDYYSTATPHMTAGFPELRIINRRSLMAVDKSILL